MSEAVAVREQEEIGLAELRQRLPELKEKADLVREFQRLVLREGIDYGPIPGTGDRDVLLKPGAESLIAWHGFDTPTDEIEKEEHDWTTGFHYYVVRVAARSGRGRIFTALRACSTFEKKYRYDRQGNERPVADLNSQVDNVLAMANKRALVAVTRLATATSGLFDEEYEEEEKDKEPEGIRVPFGKSKGKLVSELTDKKDLGWLADAIAKSIADPEKKRYKAQNERLHGALVARLAELDAPAPAPSPPVKEATPPAAAAVPPDWKAKAKAAFDGLKADKDKAGKVLLKVLGEHGFESVEQIGDYEQALKVFAAYQKATGGLL